MSNINNSKHEEVVFIGRNYKRKQNKYEEQSCCSRKKILCFCCIGCTISVITVVAVCLAFILTRHQLSQDSQKWNHILEEESDSKNFSLNDTFILVSFDETYSDYLSAIGVPWFVRPLVLSGSESVTIGQTDRGAEVITSTDLVKMKFDQEMKFDWNTKFIMDYGTSPFSGQMHVICEKPSYHIILCSHEDREKGWNMTSRWIFSEIGMVNERLVTTQNIGTKKYYRRKDIQVIEEVFDNIETTDEVSDSDDWDDDDDW